MLVAVSVCFRNMRTSIESKTERLNSPEITAARELTASYTQDIGMTGDVTPSIKSRKSYLLASRQTPGYYPEG